MDNNFGSFSTLINLFSDHAVNDNLTNILQTSFNEDKNIIKSTDTNFIKNLKEYTFNENKEDISCGICLEIFKKNEKSIILPCKGASHYFHKGDDEKKCGGILPWLKENNTCPISRGEFPEYKNEDDFTNEENNEISRFIDELNEFNDDDVHDNDVHDNDREINNMISNLNTGEITTLLANSLILSNILSRGRTGTVRRTRNVLSERNIEAFEEMQLQEALQRSISEL